MTIAFGIVAILFLMKLAWTALIPFAYFRDILDRKKRRISLAPGIDLALLLILTFMSSLSSGVRWLNNPLYVFAAGIASIAVSIALLFTFAALLAYVIAPIVKKIDPTYSKRD